MASASGLIAEHFVQLVGEVIVDAEVVEDNLIMTTLSGFQIDAGNVKGLPAVNPTATNLSFTPAAGVAAANVQAGLVEVAGDITALASGKADETSLPKLLHGRLVHVSDIGDQFGNTARTEINYPTVFPLGFFSTPPRVLIMLNSSVPDLFAPGYGVQDVTTRGFSIDAWRGDTNASVFMWIAMG